MDFKQLEVFAQVMTLGNFSKAAEVLHLTQPTVSAHIRSLETELNTELFVRTPRGATATEAGKKLYSYAFEMLALRERALCACKKQENALSAELSVVASSVPYQYLLPSAMSAFCESHPQARFRLLRRDSAAVEQALLAGEAELGLCGTCTGKSALLYTELCRDELVLITPPTPPYAKRENRPFTASELAQLPYILRESGSGTRREGEVYLKNWGIEPGVLKVVAKMDNPDAVKNAVSRGLGVSIVSRLSAKDFEEMGVLLSFQLGQEAISRPLYLVRHQKRALSVLAKRFEKHLLRNYIR